MSIITKINPKINNLLSSGHGHGDLTVQDVLMAIPDTPYKHFFIGWVMMNIPSNKECKSLLDFCLARYKKERYHGFVKDSEFYTLKRLFDVAVEFEIKNEKPTVRKISDKICESRSTYQRKYERIYKMFVSTIQSVIDENLTKTARILRG